MTSKRRTKKKSSGGRSRKGTIFGKKIRLTPMGKLFLAVLLGALILLPVSAFLNSGSGLSRDRICYLAAKYESNGHAESVGEDVDYQAYGEYQLYYAFELVPFVNWCYEKDPSFYRDFKPYLSMSKKEIPGEDFRQVWKDLAEKDYGRFEEDQQTYLIEHTLADAMDNLTEAYGYDFSGAADALKACILSVANRDGKYIRNLDRYFHGTTSSSTEEEIIRQVYEEMQYYRPGVRRWVREEADCLALLHGELDIYAVSENDAGGIDWRWKK